jgi:hypothetical protein
MLGGIWSMHTAVTVGEVQRDQKKTPSKKTLMLMLFTSKQTSNSVLCIWLLSTVSKVSGLLLWIQTKYGSQNHWVSQKEVLDIEQKYLFEIAKEQQYLGFQRGPPQNISSKLQKNNTRDSNVVPHRSTNRARRCLTSLSRREAVLSSLYGRSWLFRWILFI